MAKNGKGIIALRSTAKKGTVSTIVPLLPLGSPVTVQDRDTDYVVTEFGIARLKGLNVFQSRGLAECFIRLQIRAKKTSSRHWINIGGFSMKKVFIVGAKKDCNRYFWRNSKGCAGRGSWSDCLKSCNRAVEGRS